MTPSTALYDEACTIGSHFTATTRDRAILVEVGVLPAAISRRGSVGSGPA
ncbi:MAG: hypothetical protein P8X80_22235 [Desulfobacterales bacterium]